MMVRGGEEEQMMVQGRRWYARVGLEEESAVMG